MRKWILSILLLTGMAQGSVTYNFTYTRSSGTIQSFSIVFTTATFLAGNGSETALTPVNITNGSNNWSITKYLTKNIIGPQCFLFGTASVTLGKCGSNISDAVGPPDGSLTVILGLPFSAGTSLVSG